MTPNNRPHITLSPCVCRQTLNTHEHDVYLVTGRERKREGERNWRVIPLTTVPWTFNPLSLSLPLFAGVVDLSQIECTSILLLHTSQESFFFIFYVLHCHALLWNVQLLILALDETKRNALSLRACRESVCGFIKWTVSLVYEELIQFVKCFQWVCCVRIASRAHLEKWCAQLIGGRVCLQLFTFHKKHL